MRHRRTSCTGAYGNRGYSNRAGSASSMVVIIIDRYRMCVRRTTRNEINKIRHISNLSSTHILILFLKKKKFNQHSVDQVEPRSYRILLPSSPRSSFLRSAYKRARGTRGKHGWISSSTIARRGTTCPPSRRCAAAFASLRRIAKGRVANLTLCFIQPTTSCRRAYLTFCPTPESSSCDRNFLRVINLPCYSQQS